MHRYDTILGGHFLDCVDCPSCMIFHALEDIEECFYLDMLDGWIQCIIEFVVILCVLFTRENGAPEFIMHDGHVFL
jgi:hypothetical protein